MGKRDKKRSGLKIFFIILIILILIIGVAVLSGYLFIKNKYDKIQKVDLSEEDLGIAEEVKEDLKGYRNIAIFGIDSRSDNLRKGNRSDCIIIASINEDTGEIKMFSVYRDSYLKIDGYGLDKVTHAYSYGEAPLAIKTLNTNLDLNIDEFVTVNFDSVVKAVDLLGGIEMNITAAEVKDINGIITETSRVTGKSAEHITAPGTYLLNGVQAVSYGRIRHTEGGDYKRTERMRDVAIKMLEKLKTKSLSEINKFADSMLPEMYTNIDLDDIMKVIPNITKYKVVESIGWPYEVQGITLDRWYGVPVTLEENVTKLHQDIFDEPEYIPSETVKSISQSIIAKTGYR